MRFTTSLDRVAQVISLFVWLAQIAAAGAVLAVPGLPAVARAGLVLLLLVTLPVLLLLQPRGLRIERDRLEVLRWWRPAVLPLTSIAEARRITSGELGRVWRTFGSGGAHGYFGRFSSAKLGPLLFYVTRRDTLVLVRRKAARPWVLSPDDPDAFLEALQAARGAN